MPLSLTQLAENATKNGFQFNGFLNQLKPVLFICGIFVSKCMFEPQAAFFCFLSANFYPHTQIIWAKMFVRFDVVCSYRTCGTNQLHDVLPVDDVPFQLQTIVSNQDRKPFRSRLQIIFLVCFQTDLFSDFDFDDSDLAISVQHQAS